MRSIGIHFLFYVAVLLKALLFLSIILLSILLLLIDVDRENKKKVKTLFLKKSIQNKKNVSSGEIYLSLSAPNPFNRAPIPIRLRCY